MYCALVLCALLVGCLANEMPDNQDIQIGQHLLLDSRIVGGSPVDINQHPYQLSLQTSGHICGGSIISSKWAVTAAHCVGMSADRYSIRVGSSNKDQGTRYTIKRIIRHPEYNSRTVDFDVALLEINGEIKFNGNVKAVKLATTEPSSGSLVDVTGWGALKEGGSVSTQLMKVSIPIVDRNQCQTAYGTKNSITSRMICAGYTAGGKDSCQGDSGGPLTSKGTLYGIVSWGYGCAQPKYPGVYSNVANLSSWIKQNSGVVDRYSLSIHVEMSEKILFLLCIFLENVLASENTKYVNITEYPYHVSIEKYGTHVCSGALVHESWAITVASCVFGADLSTVSVRVRSDTLSSGGDELEVSNIVVHEDFDKYVLLNDIALIKFKLPEQFGEKLLPIGIPEKEDYKLADGTTCFVTGWKHNLGGQAESQITAMAVPIVNQDICSSTMPCYEPVLQKMLCAGNMTLGVETCQGDPGAPLMEAQTLIGVLSYGLGCKTMIHPGVYTRVSSYLPWISANSDILYTI
ncbi:serine protease 53-like [Colletes gigas]|uniref:serine protease 53-like n=1 Tax=Colletes gigas TaxID=935657 RepID=UPI001C9B6FDF|nr:serine protease 53-like [Colletes gigas]